MLQSILIGTDWLADHLDTPNLRVVDIRGHVIPASEPLPHYYNHHADYLVSHIPGAVFVDWVHAITDPADPRHAKIAQPDRFAAAMRAAGIDDSTHVIVYDDAKGMFAARLWWALNYYGHTQVAVLNGGWEKWTAEQRPVSAEIPNFSAGDFTVRRRADIYRNADQIAAQLGSTQQPSKIQQPGKTQQLIDVRSVDEYEGRTSRAPRKGHIPTAVNLPRTDLTQEDATMPPPHVLRERFKAVGVDDDSKDVVFYCNGGVSASYGLLAYHAAGFTGGSVYDGSWKDWGNDLSKPIHSLKA